jgi:hypothetical protein
MPDPRDDALSQPSAGPLPTFRLDVAYSRAAPAFAAAEITTLLLKGPAFDQLLFGGRRLRAYADIDLLVDPARVPAAGRVLETLGFRRAEPPAGRQLARQAGSAVGVLGASHATPWVRDRDMFTIDLHETLPQLGVRPERAWLALQPHVSAITVVGAESLTLGPPASALLVALHAAHHGPAWSRTRSDLERACEVLDRACWQAATVLARELQADDAMGIGLGTTAAGRAVARQLGLRTSPTPAHRLIWSAVAWTERRAERPT